MGGISCLSLVLYGIRKGSEDVAVVIDGIEKEESDTLLGITMAGLGEPVMHRMAGGEKNWALCEPR